MWVKQCHKPCPKSQFFIGGMFTIPKWVVYYCYTHITLYGFPVLSRNVGLPVWQSNMAQTWQWKIPYKWMIPGEKTIYKWVILHCHV